MKIFFNCLVYKDPDVVGDLILNIKKFVKDPVIVLHVSPDFNDFDFNRFSSINNVYINPNRYAHGQWGTKIKALVSNHDLLISKSIGFDYEIIFYPKMLFIRHGIEEYLDGVDACMPTPTKEKRDAMEYALNTKMDVFTEEEKNYQRLFCRSFHSSACSGRRYPKGRSLGRNNNSSGFIFSCYR